MRNIWSSVKHHMLFSVNIKISIDLVFSCRKCTHSLRSLFWANWDINNLLPVGFLHNLSDLCLIFISPLFSCNIHLVIWQVKEFFLFVFSVWHPHFAAFKYSPLHDPLFFLSHYSVDFLGCLEFFIIFNSRQMTLHDVQTHYFNCAIFQIMLEKVNW